MQFIIIVTIAIVYFTLLRKVINLKMAHKYSRNVSLIKTI